MMLPATTTAVHALAVVRVRPGQTVARVFPLALAAKAHALVRRGDAGGRIVLVP